MMMMMKRNWKQSKISQPVSRSGGQEERDCCLSTLSLGEDQSRPVSVSPFHLKCYSTALETHALFMAKPRFRPLIQTDHPQLGAYWKPWTSSIFSLSLSRSSIQSSGFILTLRIQINLSNHIHINFYFLWYIPVLTSNQSVLLSQSVFALLIDNDSANVIMTKLTVWTILNYELESCQTFFVNVYISWCQRWSFGYAENWVWSGIVSDIE